MIEIIDQIVAGSAKSSSGGGSSQKYGATINNFLGDVNNSGEIQMPTGNLDLVFNGVTKITNNSLSGRFTYDSGNSTGTPNLIKTVSFPDLTTINIKNCFWKTFQGQASLTSVSFPNLESAGTKQYSFGNAFYECSGLTSVSFPKLSVLTSNSAFYGAFQSCTSLTSLSFPALKSTSFGTYTNQFNSMLFGVTGCTVHFPSNLQSVIGSWSSVTGGFGGTNTTVSFDLPATE